MPSKFSKRIVVKLGTGVLTRDVGALDVNRMDGICGQIAELKKRGMQVVLVSSGAVGLGMGRLSLKLRPKRLALLQTCASVGQGLLIQTWAELFEKRGLTVAQILLTRDDVDVRNRHRALKDLLNELLKMGVVPIINENDCVSAAELNIKFGDNDVLSALVATIAKAQDLVIMSTAPGLVDMDGTGEIIKVVENIDSVRDKARGTSSSTAVGGMVTKLKAADIATANACGVYIISGERKNSLLEVFDGKNPGTYFVPSKTASSSRDRWLRYFGKSMGQLFIDEGALNALRNRGSSLLAAGVKSIKGTFKAHDLVEICDETDKHVYARGMAEVSSDELRKILESNAGKHLKTGDVAVHRDRLAMV